MKFVENPPCYSSMGPRAFSYHELDIQTRANIRDALRELLECRLPSEVEVYEQEPEYVISFDITQRGPEIVLRFPKSVDLHYFKDLETMGEDLLMANVTNPMEEVEITKLVIDYSFNRIITRFNYTRLKNILSDYPLNSTHRHSGSEDNAQ